jgi:O-methyltransferase
MKHLIRTALRHFGLEVVRYAEPRPLPALPDLPDDEARILAQAQAFTMTSPERLAALINAVKHVVKHRIDGDIVECGVWRGGSMMAAALTLLGQGDTSRRLFLYDTFQGMTRPTERDVDIHGQSARAQFDRLAARNTKWAAASLEDVTENLYGTGYPTEKIHFVPGRVEDSIPGIVPSHIAVLRLDTDWYESTKHELVHLYPLLDKHGIVIIDDYGHFQGARLAVDEYFATLEERVFLHRIDYTGRIVVRCGAR